MKTDSHSVISPQSVLGIAAICVVAGIVCGMAESQIASTILVGVGVLAAVLTALCSRRLTIW